MHGHMNVKIMDIWTSYAVSLVSAADTGTSLRCLQHTTIIIIQLEIYFSYIATYKRDIKSVNSSRLKLTYILQALHNAIRLLHHHFMLLSSLFERRQDEKLSFSKQAPERYLVSYIRQRSLSSTYFLSYHT